MPSPRKRSAGLRTPPRRLQFGFLALVIIILLIWTSTSSRVAITSAPTVADLSKSAHLAADLIPKPKAPKLWNIFGDVAHQPPEQADSSHGRTKWYSDWTWLNPFSSETTLDEYRAVLPPLIHRTPVYTFYDATTTKDTKVQEAEHKLLLTWRRAWWAQGFMPIVLGRPEAAKHPQYSALQRLKPSGTLELDFLRWLAWAHMDGGILTNWLCLPMAAHDDETLTSLRQGKFATLERYEGLSNGLFTGPAGEVNALVKLALASASVGKAMHVTDLVTSKSFSDSPHSGGLAFYDMNSITTLYKDVGMELSRSQAAGLALLQQLLNAHLHVTWQNNFPEGVAVLQPHPLHMTTLVDPAMRLAKSILLCPESPLPHSCPPNRKACTPCTSTSAPNIDLSTPPTLRNRSTQFTIGTVPHPYTFNMLHHMRENLDVAFIRRDTERDLWLKGITLDLLGFDVGGPARITRIKEAVASPFGTSHSLWITPELEEPIKADWIFGFSLPANDIKMTSGVAPKKGAIVPTSTELARENMLLAVARETLQQSMDSAKVKMVEAWNMADAEAWRFVKAFTLRRRMEREKWQDKESQFAGAVDSDDHPL